MTPCVGPVRSHRIDQSILLHCTQSGSIHLKVLHVHYTMDKVNRSAPSNMQWASVAQIAVDGIKCIHALSLNQYWQIVLSQIVKTCSISNGAVMIQLPEMDKEDAVRLQTYWVYAHALSSKQQHELPNHMNKTDKSEKQKPSSRSTINSVMIWIR